MRGTYIGGPDGQAHKVTQIYIGVKKFDIEDNIALTNQTEASKYFNIQYQNQTAINWTESKITISTAPQGEQTASVTLTAKYKCDIQFTSRDQDSDIDVIMQIQHLDTDGSTTIETINLANQGSSSRTISLNPDERLKFYVYNNFSYDCGTSQATLCENQYETECEGQCDNCLTCDTGCNSCDSCDGCDTNGDEICETDCDVCNACNSQDTDSPGTCEDYCDYCDSVSDVCGNGCDALSDRGCFTCNYCNSCEGSCEGCDSCQDGCDSCEIPCETNQTNDDYSSVNLLADLLVTITESPSEAKRVAKIYVGDASNKARQVYPYSCNECETACQSNCQINCQDTCELNCEGACQEGEEGWCTGCDVCETYCDSHYDVDGECASCDYCDGCDSSDAGGCANCDANYQICDGCQSGQSCEDGCQACEGNADVCTYCENCEECQTNL